MQSQDLAKAHDAEACETEVRETEACETEVRETEVRDAEKHVRDSVHEAGRSLRRQKSKQVARDRSGLPSSFPNSQVAE